MLSLKSRVASSYLNLENINVFKIVISSFEVIKQKVAAGKIPIVKMM